MKKTLLAAALTAGFAGLAHAETSVTLYGVLDGGFGYKQYKYTEKDASTHAVLNRYKQTRTGLQSGIQSGNRWGLRGSEDLGDGLQAVFTVEGGFDLANGKIGQDGVDNDGNDFKRLFGRQATLGFANEAWGSLTFGRQTNVASRFIPSLASAGTFNLGSLDNTFTSAATVRADNTIAYVSPTFEGLAFAVGYSYNVGAAQTATEKYSDPTTAKKKNENTTLVTGGIAYNIGPFGTAVTYDEVDHDGWKKKIEAFNFAAAYDFEVLKLHAGYGQEKNGTLSGDSIEFKHPSDKNKNVFLSRGEALEMKTSADGKQKYQVDNFSFGISVPVGEDSKLMANWAQSSPKRDKANATEKKSVFGHDAKPQNTYGLSYTYGISKRTNLYASGAYVENFAFTRNAQAQEAVFGLRHQF